LRAVTLPSHNARVWVIHGVAYQSSEEAADALGIHRTAVVRRCNGCVREGRIEPPWRGWFSYAAPTSIRRHILAEEVRGLAASGMNGTQAAEALGLTRNQVAGIARDYDIQFRRKTAACYAGS